MAVDGDTAQIGPELAENLGIPHITDVSKIVEITEKEVTCEKLTDTGKALLKVALPALLTVVKDINMPRLPSISGVRFGLAAPFEILGAEALGADAARIGLGGSPTQVVRTYVPQRQTVSISIAGDAKAQGARIARLIEEVL